jgi:hypothetical protein
MAKLPKFEKSSGNVFADLSLENADELLLKAEIVSEIARLMKVKKLTQAKAASLTGHADAHRIWTRCGGGGATSCAIKETRWDHF